MIFGQTLRVFPERKTSSHPRIKSEAILLRMMLVAFCPRCGLPNAPAVPLGAPLTAPTVLSRRP